MKLGRPEGEKHANSIERLRKWILEYTMAVLSDSQIDAKSESQIVHLHVEGSPTSTLENDETLAFRRQIEKRLVWKLDLTILPLLATVFFFSYVVCVLSHSSLHLEDAPTLTLDLTVRTVDKLAMLA